MSRLALFALCYLIPGLVFADLPFNPAIQDGETSYIVSPATGNAQYHAPAYKRVGNRVYEVSPQTGNIQYHKPSYKIEGKRIYEVSPSTGNVQYHKPSYVLK